MSLLVFTFFLAFHFFALFWRLPLFVTVCARETAVAFLVVSKMSHPVVPAPCWVHLGDVCCPQKRSVCVNSKNTWSQRGGPVSPYNIMAGRRKNNNANLYRGSATSHVRRAAREHRTAVFLQAYLGDYAFILFVLGSRLPRGTQPDHRGNLPNCGALVGGCISSKEGATDLSSMRSPLPHHREQCRKK